MSAEYRRQIRCAIYTRKSSEEGLEQSFNSLDAQREACQAYVTSQRHEGWRVVDTHYDDGGYSGGTMDRPALKRLLDDINAGGIDVVVVYKVDRLTRSLADFAKMIEIFDARRANFVSITQQFNTTTSMGRLTLNMLLSFAQFEREVTGERIRDKIAASKRKGMWMGGVPPLGYDVKDRKLVINAAEAERVREIYCTYLRLASVARLKSSLDQKGIRSKIRISNAGRKSGGVQFSRGALYELLQNRLYLGEITHRGASYPGQHERIIPQDLWDRVQAQLTTNSDARNNGAYVRNPSLLAGLIYDEEGNRFTPSHTVKSGRRYRYYVSQAAIQQRLGLRNVPIRVPAQEIEKAVLSKLQSLLSSGQGIADALAIDTDTPATTQALIAAAQSSSKTLQIAPTAELRRLLRRIVRAVILSEASIQVRLNKHASREALLGIDSICKPEPSTGLHDERQTETVSLVIEARVMRCGGETRLVLEGANDDAPPRTVPSMIKAVARARRWYEQIVRGESSGGRAIANQERCDERYVSVIMRCAFLAPDVVEAILDGRQPPNFTLAKITGRLPMDWVEQRRLLGF